MIVLGGQHALSCVLTLCCLFEGIMDGGDIRLYRDYGRKNEKTDLLHKILKSPVVKITSASS